MPAIFICSYGPSAYNATVLKMHGLENAKSYTADIHDRASIQWSSNQSDISPEELYDLLTESPAQTIETLTIKSFDRSVEPTVIHLAEYSGDLSEFLVEKRQRSFGRCHSIELGKMSKALNGIQSVRVD